MMNNILDLHGKRHHEVENDVARFINDSLNSGLSSVDIITGYSDKMQDIVIDVAKQYQLDYVIGDYNNRGYITLHLWSY